MSVVHTVFSHELQCHWRVWRALPGLEVELGVLEGEVPVMEGAIKLATVLLPTVERVSVLSGSKPVGLYVNRGKGRWEAI